MQQTLVGKRCVMVTAGRPAGAKEDKGITGQGQPGTWWDTRKLCWGRWWWVCVSMENHTAHLVPDPSTGMPSINVLLTLVIIKPNNVIYQGIAENLQPQAFCEGGNLPLATWRDGWALGRCRQGNQMTERQAPKQPSTQTFTMFLGKLEENALLS